MPDSRNVALLTTGLLAGHLFVAANSEATPSASYALETRYACAELLGDDLQCVANTPSASDTSETSGFRAVVEGGSIAGALGRMDARVGDGVASIAGNLFLTQNVSFQYPGEDYYGSVWGSLAMNAALTETRIVRPRPGETVHDGATVSVFVDYELSVIFAADLFEAEYQLPDIAPPGSSGDPCQDDAPLPACVNWFEVSSTVSVLDTDANAALLEESLAIDGNELTQAGGANSLTTSARATIQAPVNVLLDVLLVADGEIFVNISGRSGLSPGTALILVGALADPVFTIDPNDPLADRLEIIRETLPVPEPGSATLIGLGLVALAARSGRS